MAAKICYLGDGSLQGAASYLGGIMLHHGLAFDYVPSNESPPAGFRRRVLFLVRRERLSRRKVRHRGDVARRSSRSTHGSGLLMLGGWESYYGRLGEYHASPLAEVLPVAMQNSDDRRNSAQPCLVNKKADHPIIEGLPWDRPPGIGGFNAIAAKLGAATCSRRCNSRCVGPRDRPGDFQLHARRGTPLLVVGRHGRGRVAALATDVAPHWVGGLVDWGDRRITQEVAGELVEMGNWYAQFFRNLLVWTGNFRRNVVLAEAADGTSQAKHHPELHASRQRDHRTERRTHERHQR